MVPQEFHEMPAKPEPAHYTLKQRTVHALGVMCGYLIHIVCERFPSMPRGSTSDMAIIRLSDLAPINSNLVMKGELALGL